MKCSEETRLKISKALKGRISPMKGKKFSLAHRQKIAIALKGNKNGLGKICTEEKKRKISLSETGKKVSKASIEKGLLTRRKNGTLNTYSAAAKQKEIETKKRNGTLNSSKAEIEIAKLLKKKYVLKTQYKSEEYPFYCDFYIPEKDLYIEYQGHWTHGKFSNNYVLGPFNEENEEHIKVLNIWKERAVSSKFYKIAIKVWTKTDPLKRKTARDNNLNWVEFFTITDFMKWYNAQ